MLTTIAQLIFWIPDKIRAGLAWLAGGALLAFSLIRIGRLLQKKDAAVRAAETRIRTIKESQKDATEISMLDDDAVRRRLHDRVRRNTRTIVQRRGAAPSFDQAGNR